MADSQADAVPSSPIIMKVDAPSDDSENNDNEALAHSICSPLPRPMPSIFANPFLPRSSTTASASSTSKSVLRPSQLSQHVASSVPFSLTPGKLNPFLKNSVEDVDSEERKVESTNGETPKFVPLITSTTASSSLDAKPKESKPIALATTTNFVFGQNLQERVVKDTATSSNTSPSGVSSTSDDCKPSSSTTCAVASTNGTSSKEEMLFSSAIKETPINEVHGNAAGKSLTESAREYEEQRNNKRKYEEVETKTGEEDETNIMQISCKLFAYDKGVANWQERGRGILRLNDFFVQNQSEDNCFTQSRLVFRTSGVHKVILNTKIWAEMTVEQASAKSIRFTAIDTAGEIKVFLVMASPEESKQLFQLLQDRRTSEQKRQNLKKQSTGDSSPHHLDSTSSMNMDSSASTVFSGHLTDSSVDEDVANGKQQESVIQSSNNSN